MTRHTVLSWFCIVVCGAIWTFGCAGPPNEARQAAEKKVQGAKDAEVDLYAKKQFQEVMDEWNAAEKHMQAKEYGEAKTAYEKTMDLIDVAAREAEVGRQTMKVDVEAKKAEFQEMWKGVNAAIEKTRGRKGRALAKEATEWVEQINKQLTELDSGEKYVQELAALQEANNKALEFKQRAEGK